MSTLRFTDRSNKIIQLAEQCARQINHEYVGTEHLLMGMVKDHSGVAGNVLLNLGVTIEKLKAELLKMTPGSDTPSFLGPVKFPRTPRFDDVLKYANEEADALGHYYVGTEHLLLGLLRMEDTSASMKVLKSLGVDPAQVRSHVLLLLKPRDPVNLLDEIAAICDVDAPEEAVRKIKAILKS